MMSLQVDHVSMAENGSQLTDRSQMVRDRLHSKNMMPFVRFETISIGYIHFVAVSCMSRSMLLSCRYTKYEATASSHLA